MNPNEKVQKLACKLNVDIARRGCACSRQWGAGSRGKSEV